MRWGEIHVEKGKGRCARNKELQGKQRDCPTKALIHV